MIDSPLAGLKLALHHEFSATHPSHAVLFAEGSAVPTAGNAAFRIDGLSWMDDLAQHGFDVWSIDYLGYGASDRYKPGADSAAGDAAACSAQLERAARYIVRRTHVGKVFVIGDSFGTEVAGVFASTVPDLVAKLVLFAPVTPIAPGAAVADPPAIAAKSLVSPEEFWTLYASWLPPGQVAGLSHDDFVNVWGKAYLATDPTSRSRTPPSVEVTTGPDADERDIAAGRFPYDPGRIRAPTLVIYGEWDVIATESGAQRLFDALTGVESKRRVIIGGGTHIVQLERRSRMQAFQEVRAFFAD